MINRFSKFAAALGVFATVALVQLVGVTPAAADVIQSELNLNFSGCSAGCGTVTVTDITGGVKVEVDLTGAYFVATGAGGGNDKYSFLFSLTGAPDITPNISGTSGTFLVSPPTPNFDTNPSSPGFSIANSSLDGSGAIHSDGSGTWDYAIACNYTKTNSIGDCGPGKDGGTTLVFQILGSSISTTSFIPSTGSSGSPTNYFFAADVCATALTGACTGIVTGGRPTPHQEVFVPEASTLALFCAGLAALGLLYQRRRKAT